MSDQAEIKASTATEEEEAAASAATTSEETSREAGASAEAAGSTDDPTPAEGAPGPEAVAATADTPPSQGPTAVSATAPAEKPPTAASSTEPVSQAEESDAKTPDSGTTDAEDGERTPAAATSDDNAARAADSAPSPTATAEGEAAPQQQTPAAGQAKGEDAEKAQGEDAEKAQGEDAEKAQGEDAEPEELTEQDRVAMALRQAKEEKRPVEGRIIGWNQGGFHVVIDGVTTFCPRSEMELKNPKSPNFYMDKSFRFQVIKHQKRGRRIVLSRKPLLEEERAQALAKLEEAVSSGEPLAGTVSSLTDFGAFVDLGGVEGLVHVTELSHKRVRHPRDMVQVGDEVEVKVLKIEEGGDRISLSMKALEDNPWQRFQKSHPRGSRFEGKVVRKTDFGIFVELEPGMDGMIHVSQLPPGMSLEDERLEVGQKIEGWVIRTEPKRERISLSLKEIPSEDPWKSVTENYPEGSIVKGRVEDVAPFGVFIELEPGLTGLLPNSATGLPRGQDAGKAFPPGKEVEVQVGSVERDRKRISLAQPGARLEGSRGDFKEYQRRQQDKSTGGMPVLAAAFAKLQGDEED